MIALALALALLTEAPGFPPPLADHKHKPEPCHCAPAKPCPCSPDLAKRVAALEAEIARIKAARPAPPVVAPRVAAPAVAPVYPRPMLYYVPAYRTCGPRGCR